MTSKGAKGGFQNERDVIKSFNSMSVDCEVWLHHMGIDFSTVSRVEAEKAPPRIKPDVFVKVHFNNGCSPKLLKISVKLASSARGFNQIDRGKVIQRYKSLWEQLSSEATTGLRHFTGDLPPKSGGRNPKRMFIDELELGQRTAILDFFRQNKQQVISDLLAGRIPNKAEWLLTVDKSSSSSRVFTMDEAIQFYASGNVELTPQGSLKIGRITAQRKGGDSGKPSGNDLQFKFDPNEICGN